MTVEFVENRSASAYPASKWREAFCLLEPVIGRSISEGLVEDLCGQGVDIGKDDTCVSVADVDKVLSWLFGEGSNILLDYLERHLKSVQKTSC